MSLCLIVGLALFTCACTTVESPSLPGYTATALSPTALATSTPTATVALSSAMATPATPVPATPTPELAAVRAAQWPTTGWPTAAPEEQGIDPHALRAAFDTVREGDFGINSLFVVRNGFLVAEEYFAPFQPDSAQHLFSATKSVISILIGMAIEDGYIRSVDQPVLDFFPEIAPDMLDERKRRMTIAHLLTMTAGLDWYEMAPYNGDSMRQMIASPDWMAFVLAQPVAHEPGAVFCYNSGASHLLSALLHAATGQSTLAYAEERLFAPLGIAGVSWRTDPQGVNIGGWGLSLTTRDMVKLGYLYLRQGEWDGVQLVPAAWVTASTTWHATSAAPLDGWGYGYQWWLIPDLPYRVFEARGLLGQHIVVIPDLDLVVVFTSRSENGNTPIEILENNLLPAIQ